MLDVLLVFALCVEGAGVNGCGGADALENLPPKENVRPAARNAPDSGGMGMSYKLRECGESAVGPSVERRIDELNREPSCTAPLQPNPLAALRRIMRGGNGGHTNCWGAGDPDLQICSPGPLSACVIVDLRSSVSIARSRH